MTSVSGGQDNPGKSVSLGRGGDLAHKALIVVSNENGSAVSSLRERCRAICESHSWIVARDITVPFQVLGYNWLDELRDKSPEYDEIIRLVRSEQVTLIVAPDYLHLWRTDALRGQIEALCSEHGVQIYALANPIEPLIEVERPLSDASAILDAMSRVSTRNADERHMGRVRASKETRVRQGYAVFSRNIAYGYKHAPDDPVLQIVEEQAQWVRWIYEKRTIDRWGITRITNELNRLGIPSPNHGAFGWVKSTVRAILRNPIYKGAVRWGDIEIAEGKHPAIVSPELWEQAQNVSPLTNRSSKYSTLRGHLILSGLLRCGFCGHAMAATVIKKNEVRGWRCAHYARTGGKSCQHNWINNGNLEEYVMDEVQYVLSAPQLSTLSRKYEVEIERQERAIERYDKEIETNMQSYSHWSTGFDQGKITLDEMIGERQRLETERGKLSQAKHEAERALILTRDARNTLEEAAPLVKHIPEMTAPQLQNIYRKLIKCVIIKKGEQPRIEWR